MAECDGSIRRLAVTFVCLLACGLPGMKAQLVMETSVYQQVVEAVHTIFNNTCVIFMYTVENPMQALDLNEAEQLMSLPLYIARLHVRAFAYAIKTFKERIGNSYFNLKRPLFILINDSDDMREQYSKEISSWISMAYINWVIFFREETSIDDFFSEIYVPMDCIFLVVQKIKDSKQHILTEVYKIAKGGELFTNLFGTWSEDDGLSITNLALYQRRGDLRGQLIRVTSVQDPPISLMERDSDGKMTGIKGFFGTIIQILQESLNCTLEFKESDSWGSILANGSWTGAVGMLVRNETDLAATELLMTSDRLDAIEFTTPVFSTKCRTLIKRPYYTAVKWTAYSDPFYSGIWLSLLIIMLMSSGFIWIGLKTLPAKKLHREGEISLSFTDTFFYIFGALCGQGHNYTESDPIRVINSIVHMTGVIILAAYSAALISFLAVKVFVMPFTTMEGLLTDGSYKFGVVKDSADYSFFQNSSDRILQRMFVEILDDAKNLPLNYLEGLNMVCSEDKYAFMISDNMFAILEHQLPCILEPLDTIMQTTMAMAVPKRSPFRGIINTNILLMRDSGILQRIIATELVVKSTKVGTVFAFFTYYQHYRFLQLMIANTCVLVFDTNGAAVCEIFIMARNNLYLQKVEIKDHWTSVEIVDVLPLLLLIFGGSISGIAMLLLEKLQYSKFQNSFKNSSLKKLKNPRLFQK